MYSVGYRRPGRIAILIAAPKTREMPGAPLSPPIFAVITPSLLPLMTAARGIRPFRRPCYASVISL